MSTCREEILSVAEALANSADGTFTLIDVINVMQQRGSRYAESTVRTHVTALMCSNAPANHPTTYDDFERIDRGIYRFLEEATPASNKMRVRVTETAQVEEVTLAEVPAGSSDVQRHAESVALLALSEQFGIELRPERIYLPSGSRVEIDGVSHEPPVLVEVWAHQGAPKSAQRNKVLSDALKLQYVAATLGGEYRLVLCLTDALAAAPFVGRSWYADALRHANVDVEIVSIPDDLRTAIQAAQKRQYR